MAMRLHFGMRYRQPERKLAQITLKPYPTDLEQLAI